MKIWIPLATIFIISRGHGKLVEESKKIDHTRVNVELLPEKAKGKLRMYFNT